MNKRRGLFFSFEGIEGSGKSTQIRILQKRLTESGHDVVLTREPGDGCFGQKIREILLSRCDTELEPLTELFLLEADRTQHVKEIILPALEDGKIVICDRYADSSIAYQGFGRGLSLEFIRELNDRATKGLYPDHTIVLDSDEIVSLQRSRSRLKQQDMFDSEGRFESESLAFHKKVRMAYREMARQYPDRFTILSGEESIEAVAESIWHLITTRLNRYLLRRTDSE